MKRNENPVKLGGVKVKKLAKTVFIVRFSSYSNYILTGEIHLNKTVSQGVLRAKLLLTRKGGSSPGVTEQFILLQFSRIKAEEILSGNGQTSLMGSILPLGPI